MELNVRRPIRALNPRTFSLGMGWAFIAPTLGAALVLTARGAESGTDQYEDPAASAPQEC